MVTWESFKKWFNNDFWRAFSNLALPIATPKTKLDRVTIVRNVYDSIVSARYSPSLPENEIVLNKGFGVARNVPVFCVEDYIVFYFCIKELESVLSGNRTPNTFGGWTLGGATRSQEAEEMESESTEYGRYSFDPDAWRDAFGEFNALLFAQLGSGKYHFVLQFDLSNFYDSVRLDILERWIREEASSAKGWIISLLFYFLNQWNRKKTGLHPQAVGIPQDALADCSRILANYYLRKYDKFAAELCVKASAEYFRYADDQMILLQSQDGIESLMLLLTRKLDRFGLRINQKKVFLWTVQELEEHRCRSIQAIFSAKGDNHKPELVRKFVEAYFAILPDKLEKTWNGGFPLLNRLIFANLESLPKILQRKLLRRYTSEKFLLWAGHKKLRRLHALNGALGEPIDIVKTIRELGSRSVHNAFHIEALAFAEELKDKPLIEHFKTRLQNIARQMADDDLG